METGLDASPRRPRFFDTHCDTVMKVLDQGADFVGGGGTGHVSLAGLLEADVRAQVFACYVLSARHPGIERERAEAMIRAIEAMAAGSGGRMRIARTGAEISDAFNGGPIAAILGLEGADPLQGKAENFRRFAELGIRDLIFAWQDNPFSGTAFGTDTPLTPEGERLLGLTEELRVMVDVSHLSDRAFEDVERAATRPYVASHSNCRAVCPSPRNLTDPMIRALADRGGVMGINLSPFFLDPEYHRRCMPLFHAACRPGVSDDERRQLQAEAAALPRPSLDWVARHVCHAIEVGGEDCIGMGGDLDGTTYLPAGMETVADYPTFLPLLRDAGLNERQIEKFSCRNFLRVFTEVLS